MNLSVRYMPGAYQPYIRATIPGRVIGRIKKSRFEGNAQNALETAW